LCLICGKGNKILRAVYEWLIANWYINFSQNIKKCGRHIHASTSSENEKKLAFYFAVKLVSEEVPAAVLPKYTPRNVLV